MVCSGDAGIYGMAGLMYEIGEEYPEVAIEVIPGVTAALGGSAVLGAAVGHDVSLISLSDLLTPWELIEERLRCAGKADFVICLYNPSSRKRSTYLAKACEIMLEYKAEDTVCVSCWRDYKGRSQSLPAPPVPVSSRSAHTVSGDRLG